MVSQESNYIIPPELIEELRSGPRKTAWAYCTVFVIVFPICTYLVFQYEGHGPYAANRLWIVLALIIVAISLKIFRVMFQHSATSRVCNEITELLEEDSGFKKALYKILIITPWSKCQVAIGRQRNMQMRQIPIKVKGNQVATMNISQDLSSIEVVARSNSNKH